VRKPFTHDQTAPSKTEEYRKLYWKGYRFLNRERRLRYGRWYRSRPEYREYIRKYNAIHRDKIYERKNALRRMHAKRLKEEVFRHYSPSLICQNCGFADLRALSIDHVSGGGGSHRRAIGRERGGTLFYEWLKHNGYPIGYQVLCMNCQFIKRIESKEFSWCPRRSAEVLA